jgi:hypothetical protein
MAVLVLVHPAWVRGLVLANPAAGRLLHLDSSHLPYITSPHELAPMLLELAAS